GLGFAREKLAVARLDPVGEHPGGDGDGQDGGGAGGVELELPRGSEPGLQLLGIELGLDPRQDGAPDFGHAPRPGFPQIFHSLWKECWNRGRDYIGALSRQTCGFSPTRSWSWR